MKAQLEYIGGISMENGSQREYEITIKDGHLKELVITKLTWTPKISELEWGKQENTFIVKGTNKEFKSVEELMKHLKSL